MGKIKVKKKRGLIKITRKLEKTEHVNTIELDILKKNEIPALFPPQQTLEIKNKELCYTLEECPTLKELLDSEMDSALFCSLVLKLIRTIQDCNSHGIRSSNLEISEEAVFYNEKDRSFRFLFWPLVTLEEVLDFREAFRMLGQRFHPAGQDKECKRRYLSFFDSRAKFSIAQLEKYMQDLSEWWARRCAPLSEARYLILTEMSTGKRMEMTQFPFVVGRGQEQTNFPWPGDASMSRRHFSLYRERGAIYVSDLGSTNGTILNESEVLLTNDEAASPEGLTRLSANPVIRHGDYIRAGKTTFQAQFL